MNNSILQHNKFFIPSILVSFILLALPNGMLNEIYKIYEILNAEEKSFNQALIDVGINPKKYITPEKITASKGKNIIIIAIESLEQGFLGKNFDNITPNLNKLSTEWTYYKNMPQSPGGGWTAASLYSYQVGVPAFFKGQGNDYFQGVSNVKLTGLGHILNKAEYNIKHIIGKPEFAGKEDLLNAYKIPIVSEKNSIGKYQRIGWGINDYDLFNEAKLQIKEFQKDNNKPFALFISTVNTHFPNGIYDKRMEKFISKKNNHFEFSVSAVDWLINDFILYLKVNNLLNNTVIYIFPDHTLMGSSGVVINKLRKSTRQLYLLTNAKENKLLKKTSDTIYQIDLPRMIVDGAEIKTDATFLVDYLKNRNVNEFLKKNKIKLTTLNKASVAKKDYMEGIGISITNNYLTVQSPNNVKIRIPLSKKKEENLNFTFNSEEIFDFTFNSEMVLIGISKSNIKHVFNIHTYDTQQNRLHLIIFIKNGKIDKVYYGDKKKVNLQKKGKSVYFSKEDIQLITKSNNIYF
jgi:phosphoglycerol transferase